MEQKFLCKPCAAGMDMIIKLKPIGMRADKGTCANCGKRRFGIMYELGEERNGEGKQWKRW